MNSADAKGGRAKTRVLIHTYAQELLEQGLEIRQSALRDLIFERHGIKASPNLVQDEIKRFWSFAGPAISARLHRPSIPETLCLQIDQLWQIALESASVALQGKLQKSDSDLQMTENAQLAVQLRNSNLVAALLTRDEEIVELRVINARLGEHVEHLSSGVRDWKEKYDILLKEHSIAAQTHHDDTDRLDCLHRAQVEFIQELHLGEVQRLHQQLIQASAIASSAHEDAARHLEHTENHLMMETARIRDEERRKAEHLQKELRQANQILEQLRVLKSKAAQDIAELKGRLQSIGEAMDILRDDNSNLRQQNAALQNALIRAPI
ncbi:DNA-binding protein [Pseudomonas abietaniphila]|uniref:DNA-binding protein n=1 Tax=Pseudomonas abietaniphila TaxID=89065 RepID=UPI0032181034